MLLLRCFDGDFDRPARSAHELSPPVGLGAFGGGGGVSGFQSAQCFADGIADVARHFAGGFAGEIAGDIGGCFANRRIARRITSPNPELLALPR